MKPNATSKPCFSPEQQAAALAAAPAVAVEDPENPTTQAGQWRDAVLTHGGGADTTLAELHRTRGQRGRQKAPRKVATAIRLSPEVCAYFKTGGPGWQTRIDAVLREYVRTHS